MRGSSKAGQTVPVIRHADGDGGARVVCRAKLACCAPMDRREVAEIGGQRAEGTWDERTDPITVEQAVIARFPRELRRM